MDHTRDLSGVETHRLTSLYPPPAFVKQATHEQLYGPEDGALPAHIFADATGRCFPCHSKAATWLSGLFFLHKQAELPPERARVAGEALERAARHFQIDREFAALKMAVAANARDDLARLPDTHFALVWEGPEGVKERHYPLRNAAEVKTAATWLHAHRDEFAFPDRATMASKLLARAGALQVTLDQAESLEKLAGYGYCATAQAVAALEKRAALTMRTFPEGADALRTMAGALRLGGLQVQDAGTRYKLATVLDEYDRGMHLTQLYATGALDRPEDDLFSITEKVAAEFCWDHVALTTGAVYTKEALATVPLPAMRDWLGQEFVAAVAPDGLLVDQEKLATVVATLPRPDAQLFEQMAAASGVPVFARTKDAGDRGLSVPELQQLAAEYRTPAVLG